MLYYCLIFIGENIFYFCVFVFDNDDVLILIKMVGLYIK